jgi:gas vesicle protein
MIKGGLIMVKTTNEMKHESINKTNRPASESVNPAASESSSHSTKETIKQQASALMEEGREKANEACNAAFSQAKSAGSVLLDNQKHRITDEIDHWSKAIHSFAHKFRDEQESNIADVADAFADQIGSVSQYIKDKKITDIYRDLDAMAHRHPEIFIGGMFVAGLTLARFIKSSGSSRSQLRRSQRFGGYESETRSYTPTSDVHARSESFHAPTPAHIPTTGSEAASNIAPASSTPSHMSSAEDMITRPGEKTSADIPPTDSRAAADKNI